MHPSRWGICVLCTLVGTATCLGQDEKADAVYVRAIDFNGTVRQENVLVHVLAFNNDKNLDKFSAKSDNRQQYFSIPFDNAANPVEIEIGTADGTLWLNYPEGRLDFEIRPTEKSSNLVPRRCVNVNPHSLVTDRLLTVPTWTQTDIDHLADLILKNPDHVAIALRYHSADRRYEIVAVAESSTGRTWLDDVAPRVPRIVWPTLVQRLPRDLAAGVTLPVSYTPDLDRARDIAVDQSGTISSNPTPVPNYVPVDVPVRREVPVYVRREVPVNVYVRRPVPVDVPIPRYRYYDVWVPKFRPKEDEFRPKKDEFQPNGRRHGAIPGQGVPLIFPH